jgi:hypothetical protein
MARVSFNIVVKIYIDNEESKPLALNQVADTINATTHYEEASHA